MIVHLDHPNTQQVRRAAIALGDLLNEVVFVGGLMIPFFISDRSLPRMRRPTTLMSWSSAAPGTPITSSHGG